ncbi:GGDEF domain-containing protein [Oceanospirillum multiglobuliferum]|uniref:GGDEF domain-containing protein n=1 Tax=Oceanospirillum multiglobuliferum TaxID=64969 RepID=UPI001F45E807|nr:GGDEF domain-containing protein [Oceanospirillum multiglobuliferum]
MFDIDHFKKVNDTYGHQAGDEVIRVVSNTLLQMQRETDVSGRYGGEEFGIILPDTDAQHAFIMADRLRKQIESMPVTHDGQVIQFTISLGISEFTEDLHEHTEWLERSDQALYESKRNGRNQTNIFKQK